MKFHISRARLITFLGKPGSSKTLAMSLVRDNLNKETRPDRFTSYPAVDVIAFSCSPLSTSDGIEGGYTRAVKNQQLQDGA